MTDGTARPVKVPGSEACLRILADSGCGADVIEHCKAVARLAVRIARRCGADESLVEAGGLLHDLGRCRTHGIAHAVEGAKMATELKLPSPLVRIIERHVGAGIAKAEAESMGLPKKDYAPRTLEEKIVAHADNLFEGARRVPVSDSVYQLVRKGMDGPAEKVLRLHKELSEACGCDVDEIN